MSLEKENGLSIRYKASQELLAEAEKLIPLGSQTLVKAESSIQKASLPYFFITGSVEGWDIDGNQYVDLVCGLLPVILGYCDPNVDNAIREQLEQGITLSLPTTLEIELAERLVKIIPSAEKVRFGKNGTDATSAAIRLARAYTGRDHVLALGYHGWQDWYIGATSRNKGVPEAVSKLTHKLPYNDIAAINKSLDQYRNQIAAIILEPMSTVGPLTGYLETLRDITHETGIILIFDEIITGFRFALEVPKNILM